jgi:hypothetical protein
VCSSDLQDVRGLKPLTVEKAEFIRPRFNGKDLPAGTYFMCTMDMGHGGNQIPSSCPFILEYTVLEESNG